MLTINDAKSATPGPRLSARLAFTAVSRQTLPGTLTGIPAAPRHPSRRAAIRQTEPARSAAPSFRSPFLCVPGGIGRWASRRAKIQGRERIRASPRFMPSGDLHMHDRDTMAADDTLRPSERAPTSEPSAEARQPCIPGSPPGQRGRRSHGRSLSARTAHMSTSVRSCSTPWSRAASPGAKGGHARAGQPRGAPLGRTDGSGRTGVATGLPVRRSSEPGRARPRRVGRTSHATVPDRNRWPERGDPNESGQPAAPTDIRDGADGTAPMHPERCASDAGQS